MTVAVSLADKLDTLFCFFVISQQPTGSKDPFALRRQALASLNLIALGQLRFSILQMVSALSEMTVEVLRVRLEAAIVKMQIENEARKRRLEMVEQVEDNPEKGLMILEGWEFDSSYPELEALIPEIRKILRNESGVPQALLAFSPTASKSSSAKPVSATT